MSIDKFEIDNLGDYLAQRGGVDMTVPQAGSPMPGENAPSLMANHLQQETHLKQPYEHLLWKVYSSYLEKGKGSKKQIPEWVHELRNLLQDHIDTALSLKEISSTLDLHPSYISREFPTYFNNQGFGEYIRTQRIEKAKELMLDKQYSLTDISYLTGFSDQSHFTRIFKKVTGMNPSSFRKKLLSQ